MTKSDLYPTLSEHGKTEAAKLLEMFRDNINVIIEREAKKTMGKLYSNVIPYIETDSWSNFRSSIISALSDPNNHEQIDYDARKTRRAIYEEFKAEIIQELNQDLVNENEILREAINNMRSL